MLVVVYIEVAEVVVVNPPHIAHNVLIIEAILKMLYLYVVQNSNTKTMFAYVWNCQCML